MNLRRTIADRPWLLVVVGMAILLGLTLTFLAIALANPPVMVR